MGKQIYIFQHFAGSIIHQLGGYIYTEQSLVSGLGSQQGLGPQSLGAQSQRGDKQALRSSCELLKLGILDRLNRTACM